MHIQSKRVPRAKQRGKDQLGTLGSGNHFLEIDVVEEMFAPEAAEVMGLKLGCLAVQIPRYREGLDTKFVLTMSTIFSGQLFAAESNCLIEN